MFSCLRDQLIVAISESCARHSHASRLRRILLLLANRPLGQKTRISNLRLEFPSSYRPVPSLRQSSPTLYYATSLGAGSCSQSRHFPGPQISEPVMGIALHWLSTSQHVQSGGKIIGVHTMLISLSQIPGAFTALRSGTASSTTLRKVLVKVHTAKAENGKEGRKV